MKSTTIGIIAVTIGFCIVAFFAYYPEMPNAFHQRVAETTNLAGENVAGLYVKEDFYDGKVTYFFDEAEEIQRRIKGYDSFVLRSGIEAFVDEEQGLIERFTVTTNEVKTMSDIGVGDTKKQIVGAYGKNFYQHRKQGMNIMGYVDKKSETVLEFGLVNDRVEWYSLESLTMD